MPASVPPACVSPAQIFFALNDQATHQQTLSLFSPFKFPVRYKAYITEPSRYNVAFPEGSLPPLGRCLIIVKLVKSAASSAVSRTSETLIDQFKFCFYRKPDDRLVAEGTVQALLSKHAARNPVEPSVPLAAVSASGYATSQTPTAVHRAASNVLSSAAGLQAGSTGPDGTSGSAGVGTVRPNVSAVLIGALALCVLCVPSEGELAEMLPAAIRPNALHRQLAAFVLGMVVVALLRW